jgi:hypothetical protein
LPALVPTAPFWVEERNSVVALKVPLAETTSRSAWATGSKPFRTSPTASVTVVAYAAGPARTTALANAAAAKRQDRRGSGLTSFVIKDISQIPWVGDPGARATSLVRVGEDFLETSAARDGDPLRRSGLSAD